MYLYDELRFGVRMYKDGRRGKHGLELGEGSLSLLIPGELHLGRDEGSEGSAMVL